MMTSSRIFTRTTTAIGVVMVATGLAGCGGSESSVTRDDAAPVLPAQAFAVSPVTLAEIPAAFEAGGIIRARTTATLAARVMAPVVSVHVRAGDAVTRGTTLVRLDARELTAHAARGNASSLAADEAVRAAEAQIQAADAGLRLAQATHDRINGLLEKQSATAHELDQAVAALRSAEAQLSGARAQRAAASAARDAARAGADAADIGLSYTTITAPFDGVVASRSVEPGTMAVPGMPLLVIEQSGVSRLEAMLDEARAARVRVGQAVDVRLDDATDTWREAAVTEVGRLDASSHTFLVKVDLPSELDSRTGAFGRVRFAGAPHRALTVPAASVIRRGQLAFVFVVGPERLARLRPVTPGLAAGERTEVLAGLSVGESVVSTPTLDLRDGTPLSGASVPPASRAPAPSDSDGGRRP